MSRAAALLLAGLLCLSLAACAAPAPAPEPPATLTPAPSLPPEDAAAPWEPLRVYFDGLLADRGYLVGGQLYLSPRALCAGFDLDMAETAEGDRFTLSFPALTVTGEAEGQVLRAGARYLYTPEGCLLWEGRVYLPADAIERLFGVTVRLKEGRAELDTANFHLMRDEADYYEKHFSTEDVYWLTQIIVSESYQQPLAGQIGVGNVVLNRVADPLFPDSIMEVVTQRSSTVVQFDPLADGSIHMEADEASRIAACLCLEGYNTVGGSLYFVNPRRGDSTWFENALTPVVTIGDHDFYQ